MGLLRRAKGIIGGRRHGGRDPSSRLERDPAAERRHRAKELASIGDEHIQAAPRPMPARRDPRVIAAMRAEQGAAQRAFKGIMPAASRRRLAAIGARRARELR